MEDIAADITRVDPLWVRIANFYELTPFLLARLPRTRVLWRMEYMGDDAGDWKFPGSFGTDPDRLVSDGVSQGHRIVAYAYTDWNLSRLRSVIPSLGGVEALEVLPVAQKSLGRADESGVVRQRLGIPADSTVVGAIGAASQLKGIPEIVEGFLRTCIDPRVHLLCSLVLPAGVSEGDVRHFWTRLMPGSVGLDRVHFRAGRRGEWAVMQDIYRACDLVVVNSRSESWCRVLSEAVSLGVPVVVRASPCATNNIFPTVLIRARVDDFSAMTLADTIEEAASRASGLRAYAFRQYEKSLVRDRFLDVLRRGLDEAESVAFCAALTSSSLVEELDRAIVV